MSELPDKISLEAFRDEFAKQWEIETSKDMKGILKKFPLDEEWTDFMQEDDGFLKTLMKNLDSKALLTYKKEDSKIDAMYVGGKGQFGLSDTAYPPALCTMIEHENGDHPEQEMWKLTFWRSPLKVIIFYDHPKDEFESRPQKAEWLPKMLGLLKDILTDANEFHSENESTKYLFLIGAWKEKHESIYWRWASNKSWNPLPLTG